jgi:large conductance mechanosensitive channel
MAAGGFRQFLLRGNVVDLAVGVVVGAAFGSVVAAFTKDLLTPLIAAIVGKPDFSQVQFTLNGRMRQRNSHRREALRLLHIATGLSTTR